MKNIKHGFTLVEMLVVVSIIAILAVLVFEALDPLKQFREAKNARRWSQVNSLSTGVYRYIIEKGTYPSGLDSKNRQLGTAQSGCNTLCPSAENSCLDIQKNIEDYVPILPLEINGGSRERTGFMISKNSTNNVITITACGAENGTPIFVMR